MSPTDVAPISRCIPCSNVLKLILLLLILPLFAGYFMALFVFWMTWKVRTPATAKYDHQTEQGSLVVGVGVRQLHIASP
jgi:hypothetical protein